MATRVMGLTERIAPDEVASGIAQECMIHLDAPVARLGARDRFARSATNLERDWLPTEDDGRRALKRLLQYC